MNVKQRVLRIAEAKGISKTEFFREVGLSYANFKGGQKNTALSSDAMIAILTQHPDVSPAWLLLGEGSMLRGSRGNDLEVGAEPAVEPAAAGAGSLLVYKQLVSALEQTVRAQEKTIDALEAQIGLLNKR
ncbi:hypothetical protein ABTW24_11695 [Sphingobacterium thalpophilum]|uniref:HTH cro/C1-type domain-containing protein n=1 Tax=Sphingobacterium thalpophilum TaxID=259 RepID=A0ABV4HCP0_9SPHI|nr:hypothetical protein [Sphingobacterium thalpophilum]